MSTTYFVLWVFKEIQNYFWLESFLSFWLWRLKHVVEGLVAIFFAILELEFKNFFPVSYFKDIYYVACLPGFLSFFFFFTMKCIVMLFKTISRKDTNVNEQLIQQNPLVNLLLHQNGYWQFRYFKGFCFFCKYCIITITHNSMMSFQRKLMCIKRNKVTVNCSTNHLIKQLKRFMLLFFYFF